MADTNEGARPPRRIRIANVRGGVINLGDTEDVIITDIIDVTINVGTAPMLVVPATGRG